MCYVYMYMCVCALKFAHAGMCVRVVEIGQSTTLLVYCEKKLIRLLAQHNLGCSCIYGMPCHGWGAGLFVLTTKLCYIIDLSLKDLIGWFI